MHPPQRIWLWVIGGVVLLLIVIVIGSIAKPSTPVATTPTPAPGVSTPATVPTPSAVLAPTAGASAVGTATSWTMPSLVGRNLQDAQDAIQALTGNLSFFTKSHDATGAGRHQVLDRDWKVCSQNVRPGATITRNTVIDFGTAKLGERC